MPVQPVYKELEIYQLSKKLVIACYELTHELPPEEKTHFARYIRTAALNAHVNIAQSAFLKRKKRKAFLRTAKTSLVIIDAATDILVEVGFASREDIEKIHLLSLSLSQLLDKV